MDLTLNEAKNYLKVDFPDDDTLIATFVTASASYIETKLSRPIRADKMTPETTWEVPEDIKVAQMMLISIMYENRTPIGKGSEMPFGVSALINPYRMGVYK